MRIISPGHFDPSVRHTITQRQMDEFLSLKAERDEAVEELRKLCDDFGDQNWYDAYDLGEVIKNHLGLHLYKDAAHEPGTHRCALCKEMSPNVTFGKSELLEEKTGNEEEAWICKGCIEKARAEFYGESND